MAINQADVLIIGGGPGGTTFGTMMKERGWDVALLEKDHHPRFHIGESLLPMNLPIIERLGVLEEVRRIGVPKLGADFTVGNSGMKHTTFYFRDAFGESPAHAFEVRRSEFDRILFERSKNAGVRTFEGVRVRQVHQLDDRRHQVFAVGDHGEEHVWIARYVVDASGRDTFLSSANGWKKRNARHASAAVFGHFRAVTRRAGEDQGNISLYWFEHGWIWMIPLGDDIVSVGAVCRPEHLKSRKGSLDDFLLATLNGMHEVRERMKCAIPTMPAQATGNYSYTSDRMSGPGFLMIGDAYSFVDPVFSSGVYLAMNSAEMAIDVAETWLQGRSSWAYKRACLAYHRRVRRGIAIFSWFIYRFTSPAMRNLMSSPRDILQVVQAVISMLAGDVFSNHKVRRRLLVFKTIYSVSWLLHGRASLAAYRMKQASVRTALQNPE